MLPFFLVLILSLSSSALTSDTDYFIACGLPKSTLPSSEDGNKSWQSDDNPAFTPPDFNKISSSVSGLGDEDPYTRARIFESAVTYSFPVSPGPKFIRLHFTTTASYTYNTTIVASQFFVSVEANGFTLLNNFSAFLNNQNSTTGYEVYEFHVPVENDKPLNLTFSPPTNCTSTNTCYAFVNGIEIIAVPEGLYFNATRLPRPTFISNNEYSLQQAAFQTVYRINVGGPTAPDSGELGRIWEPDDTYIATFYGKNIYFPTMGGNMSVIEYTLVPSYTAPPQVYATLRFIGLDSPKSVSRNLTWNFDVDPGFDYLVRLHFCELSVNVTGIQQRAFVVYMNNESGGVVDVWKLTGGLGIAVFQDYVVSLYGQSDGTKVPLSISLHPLDSSSLTHALDDVLLNGLEILKLNQSNGNLVVPNQPSIVVPPPSSTQNTSRKHHALPIVVGAIGGTLVLAFLVIIACLIVYKKKAAAEALKKKSMATSTSNKDKWVQPPSYSSSTPSTRNSSLPSDLCRRFSLAQIRVATCDFDEKLIVGRGGFGTVYMGSIEGETTTVAIKRLNSTSKQGTHEFQTEIEMLSRLRHVNLVSLIGYCEDQGEMILVYEYMSRGTLRDHLLYNNPSTNDHTNNISLSWKERLKICVGSARGLHYLHAGAKQVIIHRDVKSTNILLDDKWTAKVSDFGLSKVGPDLDGAGITHISTAVKGSVGYLDPEYYQRRQLTEKSDVYSFGVVLFEVLCARAVVKPNLPREQANLARWATTRYKSGTLNTIVDPDLTGQISPECLRKFGEIASMCVRDRGSERPPMGDIVWGLEFALQLQEAAEKNNTDGADFEDSIPTSIDIHEHILNYDSYVSGDDLSRSSNVVGSLENRLLDSKSSASHSSDYPIDKSASVFSEIMDPKAR
ncbi:putative receptor-like protein kinase At5g39000 [Beta vulgaris subsp. vulgaris]|uniref:putative receptor-like protein kinase At5g39000 n=1 Tax=Beta vulgaris subsp. vulgaris TaxID=3555 RepID=UPI00203762A1|nr:putative receptor-like protein kinase At5g39000 [Beta vulgaris subsp. vulgaris]